MLLKEETAHWQGALTQFVRTGDHPPNEVIRPERAWIYRKLVYNQIDATLAMAYPICLEHLQNEQWDELVQAFMAQAKPQTPYIWRLPDEFRNFVANERYAEKWNVPYLDELLYFEWIEIELHMMPDEPIPAHHREGDIESDRLVLHPEFSLDHFVYPVFKMRPEKLADHQGHYYLLSYRHPDTLNVAFIDCSAVYAFMIELLAQQPLSCAELFALVKENFSMVDEKQLQQHGTRFLEQLLEQRVLIGFRE